MRIQEERNPDLKSTSESDSRARISLPQSWQKAVEKNGSKPNAPKQSAVQVPKLKPLRVIGNGAFGKFADLISLLKMSLTILKLSRLRLRGI